MAYMSYQCDILVSIPMRGGASVNSVVREWRISGVLLVMVWGGGGGVMLDNRLHRRPNCQIVAILLQL